MKKIRLSLILFLLSLNSQANTGISLWLESGPSFINKNDIRIPAQGGSDIDLAARLEKPVSWFTTRVYLEYQFADQHSIRLLYAPYAATATWTPDSSVDFNGETFVGGQGLEAYYKFNSYRLSYRYFLSWLPRWNLVIGFTGKIRDAEVRLSQTANSTANTNVGFVPLLHLAARRDLSQNWSWLFDMDGSAAPQGRAFDISSSFQRYFGMFGGGHALYGSVGYRILEGGANVTVYNFSLFQYFFLRIRADF